MLPDRFWKYVSPEPNSGCWLWVGAQTSAGYGHFYLDGMKYAHRVSYEAHRGPIPKGLVLDHLCRVRCCCNPDHLEVVPQLVNCTRGQGGANMRSKTHCPQGHEYTSENTRVVYTGQRVCRACQRISQQKRRARYRVIVAPADAPVFIGKAHADEHFIEPLAPVHAGKG